MAAELLGQAVGLVITRQEDGTVVLDYQGGPYVRLDAAKWRALLLAIPDGTPARRPTGTGWPGV
jgi:hypothetical protein